MSLPTRVVSTFAMMFVAVSERAEGQDLAHVRFGGGFGRTAPRGEYRDLGGEGYKGGWR